MSTWNLLDLQYLLSKMKSRPKPTQMLSSGSLRVVFDKFDSGRDGKISPEEYRAILRALGKDSTIKEVSKIFRAADLDGDGFIDFKDFQEVMKREGGVKIKEIESAFQAFDLDGNGKIGAEELFELLQRLGENCSLEDCRRMVRAVDAKGDGVIDMDEFMKMMMTQP